MENQDKINKYITNIQNPYILKIGDMAVEVEYSDDEKTFKECIVNILKQKIN